MNILSGVIRCYASFSPLVRPSESSVFEQGGWSMSSLNVLPEMVSAASGELQNLGCGLRSANAAAASQTTAIAAPAADEVSSSISAALGAHAQEFQAVSARAAAFHDEFVNLLNGGAAQYVSAEAANAQHMLANTVNAPTGALLGNPLIGTGQGAAGAAANAADTIVDNGGAININYPFGPLNVSLSATPTFFADGGLALTGIGALTLNTPFGSPVLASANVAEGILGSGAFYGHILETWPLGAWVTVDATGFLSPYPTLTSLAYNFDGLEISLPGTSFFGSVVPNVSWNPTP
jgi:PE family